MAAGSGSFNLRSRLFMPAAKSLGPPLYRSRRSSDHEAKRSGRHRSKISNFQNFITPHSGPLAIDRIGISFVRVFNSRPFVFLATLAPHECTRFLRPLLRIFSRRIFFRLRAHDPLLSLPFLRVTSVRFSFATVSER